MHFLCNIAVKNDKKWRKELMISLYRGVRSNPLMNNVISLTTIVILGGVGILTSVGVTAVSIAIAQTVSDNASMAGNMTGGNMTMGGGNMSDSNMTEAVGEISGGGGRCGGTCYTDGN
jgi:hypothetical protein